MPPNSSAIGLVRQFQSESDAITEAAHPLWPRITIFTLAGFFLSVIAIMFLTKIDRVVTSVGGKLVSTERVNVFQALDPSIIRSINVHEGEDVKKGQILGTLDPTFSAADVKKLRQQIGNLRAQIARDDAQLNNRPFRAPRETGADSIKSAAVQAELYKQQVAQYRAQLNSFDAKIRQTQAIIQKYRMDADRYRQREKIAKEIENMRTILAQHGTGSRLSLLRSQDARINLLRTLDYDHNSLVEAQHTLTSQIANRDAFIQERSVQISQDLITARNNLDTAQASLEKALRRHELVHISATEPSVVLTVAKVSVGSVLKQGETFFTLMPVDAPIEAEIRIASKDIGFIRTGDRCVLKIDAFNYMEHGTAEGSILWISDNAFTKDDNNQPVAPYYKADCSVDAKHFVDVPPNFRLIPGMTLQADVNVGKRSVAVYLLGGFMRGFGEAMREP